MTVVHLVMCGEKIIRAYWDAGVAEADRKAEAAKAGDKEHWWIRDVPVASAIDADLKQLIQIEQARK
jgi:hypothetical protein